MAAHK